MAGGVKDQVPVKRHPINMVEFYEVTKDDIEKLSGHGNADIFLNFGIGAISIAVSLAVALFTTTMSDITKVVFIVLSVVLGLTFLLLMTLWYIGHKKSKECKKEILSRSTNRD